MAGGRAGSIPGSFVGGSEVPIAHVCSGLNPAPLKSQKGSAGDGPSPHKAEANLTQGPLGRLSSHVACTPPSASPPAAGATLPQLIDVSVPQFLTRKQRPRRTCTSGATGRLNAVTVRAPAAWLAWWPWVAVPGACLPQSGLSPISASRQLVQGEMPSSSSMTEVRGRLCSASGRPWVSEAQAHASRHLDDPTQRVLPERECEWCPWSAVCGGTEGRRLPASAQRLFLFHSDCRRLALPGKSPTFPSYRGTPALPAVLPTSQRVFVVLSGPCRLCVQVTGSILTVPSEGP